MINPVKLAIFGGLFGVLAFVAMMAGAMLNPAHAFSYDSDAEKQQAYKAAKVYCKDVKGEANKDKCISDVMLQGYSDLVIGKHQAK